MRLVKRLASWFASVARPPFERTRCACPQCASFCKTKPGALIPSDVPRIAQNLVQLRLISDESEVSRFLRATSPSDVYDEDQQTNIRIPKIGPARNRRGRCVFLDDADRCTIHEVSPFGCAYFDAHMSKEEAERRWVWGLQQIRASATYQELRKTLAFAEGGKNEKRR